MPYLFANFQWLLREREESQRALCGQVIGFLLPGETVENQEGSSE